MESNSGDSWYVKLADGDVHRVTLNQLDEAFQAGHIDAETMVLAAGESQWTKLGALAGIDEEDVPIEAEPSQGPTEDGYVPQLPTRPGQRALPQPVSMPPAPAPMRTALPAPVAVPQSAYPSPMVAALPSSDARPNFAPSTAVATNGYSTRSVAGLHTPTSLRPVSVDSGDLDMEIGRMRKGSGKRWVASVLAVGALASGLGYVAAQRPHWAQSLLIRAGWHGSSQTVAASAPPPPAPEAPAEPAPAPVAPPPAPPAAAPGSDSPLNPHFTDRADHVDDSKARVADGAKDAKSKSRKGHGGGAAHAPSSKSKSSAFTTTGSKYDPLNSSI